LISEHSWVIFTHPKTGETHIGQVEKVSHDGIAKIVYDHTYGWGIGTFREREYLSVLKLTETEEPRSDQLEFDLRKHQHNRGEETHE
jgi:hypothetical protein